jgi:hypothetical protein
MIAVVGPSAHAQLSLRAEVGLLYSSQKGINNIGPVQVVSEEVVKPRFAVSLVPSFAIDKRWSADLRIRYFNNIYSFSAADLEEDNAPFGPIPKGADLSYKNINIQPLIRFQVVNVGSVALIVHAGPSLLFQFSTENAPVFDYNGRHVNTATVQNQFADANRPFYSGLNYGGSINHRRFSFTIDYHNNLGASFTEDLKLGDQSYSFYNSAKLLTFSIGYLFVDSQ